MTKEVNKEKLFLKIISETLSNSSFLGDDCAYLKDYNLCISQDTLFENVHFKMSTITPKQLGKKAVLVNISDILASGAKPKYITVSLCGNLSENFVKEFYEGVNEVSNDFSVTVIGGDICAGEKIVISICALGDTKNRNISSRKNAKNGYVVAVCGEFGSSAKGFEMLENGEFEAKYIKAHIEPKLYPEISNTIAKTAVKPYAMMDSSDGLYDALSQMGNLSGVRINIEYDKIPKSTEEENLVLFGGEDYSLVTMLDKEDFEKIRGLVQIGTVSAGGGVWVDGKEIIDDNTGNGSFKHWS